ncbi:MAG: hypothetical protein J0I79_16560 [Mesorhizobium sp.]|uniref:hypothetical protein n=1 Tax=Mesorhizobium sp. TaxID=1871066 RepID=UPI001AC6A81C|nr:hypothetical protein [Mesorhizobium sp.]MBN9219559.1 hypothetical protein [Mesorhizobium sp.]
MKKPSKGKLLLPRILQIKMAAHPDIAANMETVATSIGLTSATEVVKVALHRMAQDIQRESADWPRRLAD